MYSHLNLSPIDAVCAAIDAGDTEHLRRLLIDGANPNACTHEGIPLLQWAMYRQQRHAFEVLLVAGAYPQHCGADGRSALHVAAQMQEPEWLDALLARGADPNVGDERSGTTPLMAALMSERVGNADRLIAAGADLDATDRLGNTALHVAAKINQFDRVLGLLRAGAQPSLRNAQQATFQPYMAMANASVLSAANQQARAAVSVWLYEHRIAIEE